MRLERIDKQIQRFTAHQRMLIAGTIGFLCSVVLYTVLTSSSLLTASIATLDGTSTAGLADIGVSYEGDEIVMKSLVDLPEVTSLSVLMFHDPDTVQFDSSGIDSEYTAQLTPDSVGGATLVVTGIDKSIDAGAHIVSVPTIGIVADTVVSDATVTFADGSYESLRIELP